MKITRQQFKDAMVIVEDYLSQVEVGTSLKRHEIGCRVILSMFGLEMQGNRKKNRVGTVVDFMDGQVNKISDGLVWVKWDKIKTPEVMHISHIVEFKMTDNQPQ